MPPCLRGKSRLYALIIATTQSEFWRRLAAVSGYFCRKGAKKSPGRAHFHKGLGRAGPTGPIRKRYCGLRRKKAGISKSSVKGFTCSGPVVWVLRLPQPLKS